MYDIKLNFLYLYHMKKNVTENKINKVLYRYFDMVFEDSELFEYTNTHGESWVSIMRVVDGKRISIVGRPLISENDQWYWSGPFFENAWVYFSIEPREFGEILKNYLNDTYNLGVRSIM
jgi:hypothetical protein